ncbi:MAG: cytochrome c oxidase subunit II [Acidimicrobiia bacterium]
MRHPKRRIAAPLLLAGLTMVLAACGGSDNKQNSLKPHGPAAQEIHDLFIPILGVAIVIGILVLGATVYMAIRFRAREGKPDNPKQVHGHTALEIGWTIVPALILAVVAVPTVSTIWDLAERPVGPNVLKVDVVGKQWWWQFQLPKQHLVPESTRTKYNPSKTDGMVTTSTELHIPVGTKVDVALHSYDVIHSFWVPELNGKKDVMPARSNHLTLEADKAGTYLGSCAEYCGLSHARMRFRVIAEPMADWIKWRDTISGGPAQPYSGEIKALTGKTYACTNCHVFDDAKTQPYGPNLTHFADRSTFAGGTLERTAANLKKWILNAPGEVAMSSKDCRIQPPPKDVICVGMPSFTKNTPHGLKTMTSADADKIVTYLMGEK